MSALHARYIEWDFNICSHLPSWEDVSVLKSSFYPSCCLSVMLKLSTNYLFIIMFFVKHFPKINSSTPYIKQKHFKNVTGISVIKSPRWMQIFLMGWIIKKSMYPHRQGIYQKILLASGRRSIAVELNMRKDLIPSTREGGIVTETGKSMFTGLLSQC